MKKLIFSEFTFVLLLIIIYSCNKEKPTEIQKEAVAKFSVENDNCEAPCEISFKNSSENATIFHWDFGDGNTTALKEPKHTYSNPGEYMVKMEAIGPNNVSKDSIMVKVAAAAPYFSFKANGILISFDTITITRSNAFLPQIDPPILGVIGRLFNAQFPVLSFEVQEPIANLTSGFTITFGPSSSINDVFYYNDPTGKFFSGASDNNGVQVIFTDLNFYANGLVSGIFSGSISSPDGVQILITEGKFRSNIRY